MKFTVHDSIAYLEALNMPPAVIKHLQIIKDYVKESENKLEEVLQELYDSYEAQE